MDHRVDEALVPAWLDDNFFRTVIRKFTHDEGTELCHGCKLRPGTKPGEHFASVMYRTTIHYRSSKGKEAALDVIMKIKPFQAGLKKDVLNDGDLFVREIRVYSRVLPEMGRRLKEIGETINHPRLIYASEVPHTILILEDVSGKGWQTGQYITSLEEVIPAIKTIAKFHAASVVLQQDNPSFSIEYQCGVVEKLRALDGMLRKSFVDLLAFMRSTDGFEELIVPVEMLQGTLLDGLIQSYAPSTSCMNVLVHGDFHSKNLLHQICSWTTPAVDLFYLLDTIVDQALKERYRDELIYLYHEEFARLLRRLGYLGHITTLLELQMELLQKGALELFHYVALYPFRFIDRSKVDFEQMLSGAAQNPAAGSPVYKRVMRTVLTRFLHQGVMETS
ncbi:AGAP003764-PA-like protein [Anopheles sinensis]|uniref:AGAP003764-PA-like protein n=1 Tax=Anopheles sinensis TaxID=74873 RepID=A0A084VGM6_ANOSI|nr:AGAP003764-PA-like protein [Anopheles sinensis]